MARILVIEDNRDLAFGLRNNLELEGYEVRTAGNGEEGLRLAAQWLPQLVILDLMMPGIDGFEVLARLRREAIACRVLILTARGEEIDKVRGLRGGADDYLTKPFGLLELIARVEALLRRSAPPAGDERRMSFGDIVLDPDSREVWRDAQTVSLTPKEYGLLLALIERAGGVASRLELMREVWGHSAAVISRTVDTHIGELRRKLEANPKRPRHILTVHKVGYRMV